MKKINKRYLIVATLFLISISMIWRVDSFSNSNINVRVQKDFTFEPIIEAISKWTTDYKIQGCTAENITESNISTMICTVYSPSKRQNIIVLYIDDKVTLSSPIDVTDFYANFMLTKPSFNNLSEIIPPNQILAGLIKEKGLNTNNRVFMYLGEATINKYDDRYVWQIDELSASETDANNIPKTLKTYYVDALTGLLLE